MHVLIQLVSNGLKNYPQPFWLALFAEGTRFTQAKLLAAQEYASLNGLPDPEMCSFREQRLVVRRGLGTCFSKATLNLLCCLQGTSSSLETDDGEDGWSCNDKEMMQGMRRMQIAGRLQRLAAQFELSLHIFKYLPENKQAIFVIGFKIVYKDEIYDLLV
ncbi:hypothetical protein Tco_0302740 [Tanacetum coccineum]